MILEHSICPPLENKVNIKREHRIISVVLENGQWHAE
jgi:hypothetical protein